MRLGIICENSIPVIEIIGQELKSGNSLYIINKNSPIELLIKELKTLNISKLYVPQNYNKIKNLKYLYDIVFYDPQIYGWCSEPILHNYEFAMSEEEAIILATSGTTQTRKLILLSHKAINLNAEKIYRNYNLHLDDKFCLIKNFAHSSTFVGEILMILKFGISGYVCKQLYSGQQLYNVIKKTDVTFICLNPVLLDLLYNFILRNNIKYKLNLRKIYVSGSLLNNEKKHYYSIVKDIKIFNCYGQTELGPRVTMQSENNLCSDNIFAVGFPLDDVTIKINPIENHNYGEVIIRTNTKMTKYLSNHKLAIIDDWVHTGDMGFLDKYGELNIIGRVDDQITINSINFNPNGMEILLKKEDCFNDCMITKIRKNLFEEVICFYQEMKKDIEIINAILQKNYNKELVPKTFVCVENILYSENGKKIRDLRRYSYK